MQLDLFTFTPDNAIVRSDALRTETPSKVCLTNCTVKIGPGCEDRRATFVQELPYDRCQILWPNHTITQTLIRGVVIRDGEEQQ